MNEIVPIAGIGKGTIRRVLDQCHQRRNIAEYERHLEINDALLKDLLNLARLLYGKVSLLSS